MSGSSEYAAGETLDERPSDPWLAHAEDDSPFESVTDAHPKADDFDDPLDPIEGKTTRMEVPPPSAPLEDAPSWANEVPSKLEMIEDLTVRPPPVAPPESQIPVQPAADYSLAWDTRPPPELLPAEPSSSVFEALDANAQRDVEPPAAGATTWKPTADRAITDLDLSERAQRLQEANAETRPSLEKVVLGRPIPLAPILGTQPRITQPPPDPEPDDLMPEEATLAGGPPAAVLEALQASTPPAHVSTPQAHVSTPHAHVSTPPAHVPTPHAHVPTPHAHASTLHASTPHTHAHALAHGSATIDGPVQTAAAPPRSAPTSSTPQPTPPIGDEAPTWAPEHNADVAKAALKEARDASAIRATRRAPTKLDDAAIVDEALGAHQRYLITVAFAILGLLAGVATALLS